MNLFPKAKVTERATVPNYEKPSLLNSTVTEKSKIRPGETLYSFYRGNLVLLQSTARDSNRHSNIVFEPVYLL